MKKQNKYLSNKIMIGAQQFVEKYTGKEYGKDYDGSLLAFVEMNFPKALQNFADKICEKQREICLYKRSAFYTNWFIAENNYNSDYNMIVIDRTQHLITFDGETWQDIDEDHL